MTMEQNAQPIRVAQMMTDMNYGGVEMVVMKQVSEEVCEAVQMILEKGPDAAMNVYNGRKVEKA